MACHRNIHHLHNAQPCCCCRCCCSSFCCPSAPHPANPITTTPTVSDPVLQAIAAHLLQSSPAATEAAYHVCNQQYAKSQYLHHQQQRLPPPQAQSLIQSLLRRIAALESTLPHLTSPPPPDTMTAPPPRHPRPSPPVPPTAPRASIRDLAARTIQARFRLYLVRRSQALRHLKHLASVRSHVAAIKSSLSDEGRFRPEALSQKATDLLLQLDSIQSTDPMIREGKRSITRELVRLLEFADEVSAKRHELYMESMEIAHEGTDRTAFAEKSCPGVEALAGVSTVSGEDDGESDEGSLNARPSTTRTAKRMSFAENGNGRRVPAAAAARAAAFSEEVATGCSADRRVPHDHRRASTKEAMRRGEDEGGGIFFSRASENGVGSQLEGGGGGYRHSSDEETSPGWGHKPGIRSNGRPSDHKGSHLPGLSAPLPLQMEPRRGDSKQQKKMNVMVS